MEENTLALAQNVVLETLQLAVCQSPEYLKSSERKLKEWERVAGFNTVLQNIFSNYEISHNIRLLAILCCKNGIDRYWRKTAPNALSEQEKMALRRGFLSDFREPLPHLAKQKAILIAKIARYDCPNEWGELMPTLLEAIQNEDPIVQNRSLLILGQIIKNLSSKRLAGDKRMFKELAHSIFSLVYSVWSRHCDNFFLKQYGNSFEEAKSCLENALISLRILDKLTIYGFTYPAENQEVGALLSSIICDRLKATLQIRYNIVRRRQNGEVEQSEKELVDILEKFICKQFSVLVNLLENHPFAFVNLMKGTLELCVYFAFTPDGLPYLFERFLIQCFNMIRAILLCPEYRNIICNIHDENPETVKANSIKVEFFSDSLVTDICRKLVTHYFLLTPADLELWENDPETFAAEDAGESWKYSLRPCVETLFVTVFHEFRKVLAPVLGELIQSNAGIVYPQDFDAILAKDAVYNAIGLAAFDMYDEVNFNDWFITSLREEVGMGGNNYRIVRRRVAWLLGCWTGVKLSYQLYPTIYQSMIPLLDQGEDLVVRLQAAHTIKTVVDDFEFSTELFLDYLQPLFDALFQLLKDVQECDTKMRVLSVLYFIVERVGSSIEPHYENLLKYLPLLWNESENHNMLRCAVIGTLVNLVKALGHIKVPLAIYEFIISIISFSTDVSHDSGFYLLEDGLELWLVVVKNISQLTPDIMSLFSNMPPLLGNNTEFLRCSINIMQAYVLLAPHDFLKTHGEVMVKTCGLILHDLEAEGIMAVLKLFELCIKAHAGLSVPLLKPYLQDIFEHLCQREDNWNVLTLTTVQYSLLSRLLLCSKQQVFVEMLDKLSMKAMKSRDEVMGLFLENWFKHMPLISMLDRKKLNALALSSLLTANSSFVYDKFCGILLAVVEVLNDLTRVDFQGELIDSLMFCRDIDLDDDDTFGNEDEIRRKKLAISDPIHSVHLEKYFSHQLNELERQVGAEKFQGMVDTVDVETLDMVSLYINIRAPVKEPVSNDDFIKLFHTQLGI